MLELASTELLRLTSAGESEQLEYKESFGDDALEAMGAFANASGGTLLVGVKDSGAISGFQVGKKTLADIAHRIQEATEPRIQPSVSVAHHEKKMVVVIHVSAMTISPVSVRGRYFRRTGASNQRMSHEEIMQRIVAKAALSWDSVIEHEASVDDLEPQLISYFVRKTRDQGREPIPQNLSDIAILQKLELVQGDKPTRAAMLLFGKNPGHYFHSAFLKVGRFRSPTMIVDDREFHGSLISQLEEAENWFRDKLSTEFIITGKPERDVKWEYPLMAIREALCNILAHRDYNSAAHSQIRLYDNKLEFWNAGSLQAPLTTKLLFTEHASILRNKKIAQVFYSMGLIERWGTGTIRIAASLQEAQRPAPEFFSENGQFKLIFSKDFVAPESFQKMGLSKRQLQAVAYVEVQGSISNNEYQALTGASERTASRELSDLKAKEIFITKEVTGRGTSYRLKK